jgi:histidyl-tRNA synthetase
MIAALESLGRLPSESVFTNTAIACVRQEDSGLYQSLAQQFRRAGIRCEVFTDAPLSSGSMDAKQLVKQFVLAEKKGLRWIIIPGNDPLRDTLTLRDLAARQNREGLSFAEIVNIIGCNAQ